jgi:hypothetical protein
MAIEPRSPARIDWPALALQRSGPTAIGRLPSVLRQTSNCYSGAVVSVVRVVSDRNDAFGVTRVGGHWWFLLGRVVINIWDVQGDARPRS